MLAAFEMGALKEERTGYGAAARPTLRRLSFRCGACVLPQPPKDEVVIIDDFWHDPHQLRRQALAAEFRRRSSSSGFVYNDALAPNAHTYRLASLLSRVIGPEELGLGLQSRFVFETGADEVETRRRVWVHYDRWRWVAVLYLADPQHAVGGTEFYRHIETGYSDVRSAERDGRRASIMRDSTDNSKWETMLSVPIKINRMLVFRPYLFHQATCYFGSDVQNARLYNIIAFPVREG